MEDAFVAFTLCCAAFSLGLLVVTHLCVRHVLARRPTSDHTPPVSVLKPLKGLGPGLWENLVALARQDYPDFELVFGIADPRDPAVPVVRWLQREFPKVRIVLVTGAPDVGMNPKVNNLRHMERAARHATLLISDADVRPGPDYLKGMAAELAPPGVELVCSALAAQGEQNIGAALENLHLGAFVTSNVCGAEILCGRPLVVGKSMLFTRDALRAIGGWDALGSVLAEDYAFGEAIRRLGRRVVLSTEPVPVINQRRSFADFWARHVRWGQMRRHIIPRLYFAEPLLLSSLWLVALWWLTGGLGGPDAGRSGLLWWLSLAGLGLRVGSDWLLVRVVRGHALPLRACALPILKDFISLGTWAVAAFRTTVEWRGTVLQIGPGSVLTPLEAPIDIPATAAR